MSLPLRIRPGNSKKSEVPGSTQDVSFRGLYFLADAPFEAGNTIEFVLTLPKAVTLSGDVNIRCFGQVVRVETRAERRGVAAKIERYEFLPS
jgi:hypothetical protein